MSEKQATPDAEVRGRFEVLDSFVVENDSLEYKIKYVPGATKAAFRALFTELRPKGFLPRLYGTRDDATLLVTKTVREARRTPRVPVVLLSFSILSIVVTAWFLSTLYAEIAPQTPPLSMALVFSIALIGILGLHEVAHARLARRSGERSTLSYFIPNIPILSVLPNYFLPTFGSVTTPAEPQVDRDSLFDLYFVGPVVGLVLTMLVSAAGAVTPISLSASDYERIFGAGSSLVAVNLPSSLLQMLVTQITEMAGWAARAQPGTYYFSSPLGVAGWIGFLLTFFSLLPATPFDGGKMTNVVLGERWSRIITVATVIGLLLIDAPTYLVIALLVFLLSAIRPSLELLDSVSEISTSRKALYVASLLLLMITIPVPQTLATIPLF